MEKNEHYRDPAGHRSAAWLDHSDPHDYTGPKTTEIARTTIARLAFGSAMQYARINYGVKPKEWNDDGVDRYLIGKEVLRIEAAITGRNDSECQTLLEEASTDKYDSRLFPSLTGGPLAVFRAVVEAAVKDQLDWKPPAPRRRRSEWDCFVEAVEAAIIQAKHWLAHPDVQYVNQVPGNLTVTVSSGTFDLAMASFNRIVVAGSPQQEGHAVVHTIWSAVAPDTRIVVKPDPKLFGRVVVLKLYGRSFMQAMPAPDAAPDPEIEALRAQVERAVPAGRPQASK